MVLTDNDALKPALYRGLVEGLRVCGLLLDEVLQLIDADNLCVPGSSVNRAFFALLSEFEDLIGNLVVDFPAPARKCPSESLLRGCLLHNKKDNVGKWADVCATYDRKPLVF